MEICDVSDLQRLYDWAKAKCDSLESEENDNTGDKEFRIMQKLDILHGLMDNIQNVAEKIFDEEIDL